MCLLPFCATSYRPLPCPAAGTGSGSPPPRTALKKRLVKGLQVSLPLLLSAKGHKKQRRTIDPNSSFLSFYLITKREKKLGIFPFPGSFTFEYGLNKVLGPGPIEAASGQQFYERGAKIKSFALIGSRNQFLLVGFFSFTDFCNFTRVINTLPFEKKKKRLLQN